MTNKHYQKHPEFNPASTSITHGQIMKFTQKSFYSSDNELNLSTKIVQKEFVGYYIPLKKAKKSRDKVLNTNFGDGGVGWSDFHFDFLEILQTTSFLCNISFNV